MEWEARIGRRLRLRDLHILMAVVETGSMAKAALRSPGFNLRNSVRAFLMSRSDPLSAAACRATVVG